MISPTDLFHPSPAPHFKTFQVFLIYCPKRPSFSTMIRNKISFYGEELLATRPAPMLEGHPLSAVRDCLSNIFAATLHIGGRSSIRNLRTRPCHGDRDPLITERRGVYRVLVGKPEGKRPLVRPRRRREDNIKMIFRKWDVGVWTGSIWLRTGTGGGLL